LASADQLAELVGAVVSIAGVGWSVYNNKKAAKAAPDVVKAE
jgi:hypothetical protein